MLLLLVTAALAQDKNPFSVSTEPLALEPGAQGTGRVVLHVPAGTYLYADMSEISVADAGPLVVGAPSLPPSELDIDPAAGTERMMWRMDAIIEVPVTAPSEAGSYELLFEARYQGCKNTICYMPQTELVALPVTVAAAAPLTPPVPDALKADTPTQQVLSNESPVRVSVSATDAVQVTYMPDPGWHLTQQFTYVELEMGTTTPCAQSWPAAHQRPDPAAPGSMRGEFDDRFTVNAQVNGAKGDHLVKGTVGYQACKDDKCLLPQSADFTLKLSLPSTISNGECAWTVPEVQDSVSERRCATAPGGGLLLGLLALMMRRRR